MAQVLVAKNPSEDESRCLPHAKMVEPIDLRQLDDSAQLGSLYCPGLGGVAIQRAERGGGRARGRETRRAPETWPLARRRNRWRPGPSGVLVHRSQPVTPPPSARQWAGVFSPQDATLSEQVACPMSAELPTRFPLFARPALAPRTPPRGSIPQRTGAPIPAEPL